MTRYSCADYAWPSLSHPTVMAIIADLGFDGVDVAVFGDITHVTVAEVLSHSEERAEQVRSLAAQHNLAVADVFLTAHHSDITRLNPTSRIGDDVEALRQIFECTARFAQEVGSAGITMLPGIFDAGRTRDESFALAAESLSSLIDIAATRDLTVSVEPHVGSIIPRPDDIAELLDMVPGLTITLDPAHLAFQGIAVDEMLSLLSATRHLQARFGAKEAMQVGHKDNAIDYPTIVRAMLAGGYDGWLASEFVWMAKWDCDRVDNTAESAEMLDYLREIAG